MNDPAAVAMALATLAKPGDYVSDRKEWAALVKGKRFEIASEAEQRSWPRKPGIYRRWFYRMFEGMSLIQHQDLVIVEVDKQFYIGRAMGGEADVELIPVASVGGYYEFITEVPN